MQVVFLVDVDFMISSGLQERLKEPEASAALLRSVTTGRSAIVVPAFETDPKLSLVEGSDIAKRTRSSTSHIAIAIVGIECTFKLPWLGYI